MEQLSSSEQRSKATQVIIPPPPPDYNQKSSVLFYGYCIPRDFFNNYQKTHATPYMYCPHALLQTHIGHDYLAKVMAIDPYDGTVPPHCVYGDGDRVLVLAVMDNFEHLTVPTEAQFKKLEQLTGQKPRWWMSYNWRV